MRGKSESRCALCHVAMTSCEGEVREQVYETGLDIENVNLRIRTVFI